MADSIDARADSLLKATDEVVPKVEEEHLALRTQVEEEFNALLLALQQRKQATLEAVDKERQVRLAQVEAITNRCKELKDCLSTSAVDSATASSQDELEQLLSKPLPHTKCGLLVGTWCLTDALCRIRVLPAQVYTVGSELSVHALNSVSTEGRFLVRLVHPPGEQEACLRDISELISYDLGQEPTPPLDEPHMGDLCCARYYGDNKWYRARVESAPRSGKAKVLFLDFGSLQDISTNELLPLKDKYLQIPFQVLLCALSEDAITLSREAKWKFGDEIRSAPLTVNIIKELSRGYEYVVSVWRHSPQPVCISEDILRIARAKETQREVHPIIHRDVRLRDAQPTSGTSSKEAPPPNQVDMATGNTVGCGPVSLNLKGVKVLQRPKLHQQEPKPDVQEPKPDVQEPKPDVQEPKPDVQEPKPDVQEPKPDVQEPKPDVQEPKPDAQEPKPDVQEPKPELHQPKPDSQEPKLDVEEPKPDSQESKPDSQESKPDSQEPKLDVQEPKPDSQEPKPNVQKPKPNMQKPKPDVQESKPNSQGCKSDELKPKPDVQLEPKPDSQEPKPDVQELKPNVQKPKLDSQEPKPDVQEPKPNVQKPKLDVQEPKPNLQGTKPDVQKPKLLLLPGLKADVQKHRPDLQPLAPRPGGVGGSTEVPTSSVTPRNMGMGSSQPTKSTLHNKAGRGGKQSSMVDASEQLRADMLSARNRTGRRRDEAYRAESGKALQPETIDLHPSVRKGHQVSLVVVSELSRCGEFWAQVAIEDEDEEDQYKTMAEELQEAVQKYFRLQHPPWPCGAICAARYTEDRIWYRAQVESPSCDGHVTVRYIDFGNAEEIPVKYVRPLDPGFWSLPCHAMKCSIALEESQRVTNKMCQKFNKLTSKSEEDPVKAKVVAIDNNVACVQLLMEFEGRDPIDLNDEVLLSDLSAVSQLEFSLTPVEPPPGLGSWADRMDELMSPSALLPEDDVPREKSPLDWLSTPDEEKGAVGETFTFSKKQKVPGGEWSNAHPNRAGLARLFQSSLRGVHLSDDDYSTGKQDRDRTASPFTMSCETEADGRGRVKRGALHKDRRHHASEPSLAGGTENWEEETEDQVGEGGGGGRHGHAHARPDSPWEGSHIKLYVGGLCSDVHRQQVAALFQPQVKVHAVVPYRHWCFVMVDRDGYEEKMKELNGKVIPGVSSSSSRGLIVEVSKKRKSKKDPWRQKRT